MKYALYLLPPFLLLLGWSWWRRRGTDRPVSAEWLRDQQQREQSSGVDAVNWRWPVRKVVNESGMFNAAKLRKRA